MQKNASDRHLDFILDDESYFTLSNIVLAGNVRFYSNNLKKTKDEVKNSYKTKNEKKLLMWLEISPKGISKLFFILSGLAINQDIYAKHCIKERLLPFIKKHYPNGGYVFWPDLASSHYSNKVLAEYQSQNVNFVVKWNNPANLPKARPIEDFWGNLKRLVYTKDWSTSTLTQLENRIIACLKNMDLNVVQAHAESVGKRLDNIRRYGVESIYN
jgi:hypothetical protein